jgi:WD40 repeat protein
MLFALLVPLAFSLNLNLAWTSTEPLDLSEGIAFSEDGTVAVASDDGCVYFMDSSSGRVINATCSYADMDDVTYLNGKFVVVSFDHNAYIFDAQGNLEDKLYVGGEYDQAVRALDQGFIACDERCGYFSYNGTLIWSFEVGEVDNAPGVSGDYAYVADLDTYKVYIVYIPTGAIVNNLTYSVEAYDAQTCGNYLAVTTYDTLYLYDISNPREPTLLWDYGGLGGGSDFGDMRIAFSPDCQYIAVSDTDNYSLKIFDSRGNLLIDNDLGRAPHGIAWQGSLIVLSLDNGTVIAYNTGLAIQTTQSAGIPAPFLLGLPLAYFMRRRR